MSEIRTIGVKSIKIGDIMPDGGMGTSLTALGVTYQDSAILEQADPTETEFYAEEQDMPIETSSVPGKTTLKWAIVDLTAATLVKVLGGTDDSGTWKAPDAAEEIEQSIEIISKKDVKIEIPRAKIQGKLSLGLSKNQIGQVQITATVLQPTKALEPPMKISQVVT